jgi:hypothetical protein
MLRKACNVQQVMRRRWEDRYIRGMPDLVLAHGWENLELGPVEILAFVECKVRGAKVSPLQRDQLESIARHWQHVYVLRFYPPTKRRGLYPETKAFRIQHPVEHEERQVAVDPLEWDAENNVWKVDEWLKTISGYGWTAARRRT